MQRGRLGSSANGQGKHQRVKVDVAIAEQLDGVLLSCVYMCALLFSDCARALFCGTPRQTCKQAAAVMLRRRQTNRPTLFRTHVQPCKEIYLTPYLGIMLMWFATSYLPFALCARCVCHICWISPVCSSSSSTRPASASSICGEERAVALLPSHEPHLRIASLGQLSNWNSPVKPALRSGT